MHVYCIIYLNITHITEQETVPRRTEIKNIYVLNRVAFCVCIYFNSLVLVFGQSASPTQPPASRVSIHRLFQALVVIFYCKIMLLSVCPTEKPFPRLEYILNIQRMEWGWWSTTHIHVKQLCCWRAIVPPPTTRVSSSRGVMVHGWVKKGIRIGWEQIRSVSNPYKKGPPLFYCYTFRGVDTPSQRIWARKSAFCVIQCNFFLRVVCSTERVFILRWLMWILGAVWNRTLKPTFGGCWQS